MSQSIAKVETGFTWVIHSPVENVHLPPICLIKSILYGTAN